MHELQATQARFDLGDFLEVGIVVEQSQSVLNGELGSQAIVGLADGQSNPTQTGIDPCRLGGTELLVLEFAPRELHQLASDAGEACFVAGALKHFLQYSRANGDIARPA